MKKSFQFSRSTQLLLAGNIIVLVLLAGRVIVTGKITYAFLLWNLFLAFVPLWVANFTGQQKLSSWKLLLASMAWLVFFPNAPYLITDLYHLSHFKGMPIWYDAMMLFIAAFTGVAMGFISLQLMEQNWREIWQGKRLRKIALHKRWRYRIVFMAALFLLTGFGIYMGRVLRWNSWDIITDTHSLAYDIAIRVARPFAFKLTWGFTTVYAIGLFFLYEVWQSFRTIPNRTEQ